MIEQREKIGKISHDLWHKKPEASDPIEQMREQLSDYDKNMFTCISEGKTYYKDDFYIVVITKRERLMPNVFRNYFFHRHTCPTPDYDQAVYIYKRQGDEVEFIWVIPSKPTCIYMLDHALDIKEKELLHFVIDFNNGTLMKKALILNNELER